jgi:hypothetical protein
VKVVKMREDLKDEFNESIIDETNFYDDKELDELRKNDAIRPEEEAFMKGYLEADKEYEEQ